MTSDKPREWWISIGHECDDIVWHSPVNDDTIHVVEYFSYQELKKENEGMRSELEILYKSDLYESRAKLTSAMEMIKHMEWALSEYAKTIHSGDLVNVAENTLADLKRWREERG